MEQEIKVLLDTNIIQDSTADALAIQLKDSTQVNDGYVAKEGDVIKKSDTGIVVETTGFTRLGDIKARIADLNASILANTAERDALLAKADSFQAKIEQAFTDAIKAGAKDERSAKP